MHKLTVLILIIIITRCRHWSIAKYFGDVKPECNLSCDACKENKKVSKAVDDLRKGAYANVKKGKGGGGIYFYEQGDDDDMYGGGRRGAKRLGQDHQFLCLTSARS